MELHRGFVEDLAIVLAVAAITTVLSRKLRLPVVLGYLLAGIIVGPHVPIPLFADLERVHDLSELGVILVMFAIGLEFSFRKLIRLASTSGMIALIQIALMLWLGYLVGQAFGWTPRESFYTGAMISISSTMIIAKAFSEFRVGRKVTDLVLGVLIFEDVAAVLILAMLMAFSGSGGPMLTTTAFQLIAFLVALVLIGFFIVPRFVRFIAKMENPETLMIASIGICFFVAMLAQRAGYSVALGAFLAGALVAESGQGTQVEHLIQSMRDLFAAIFFVSVGMLVNPSLLLSYWLPILVLTVIVVVGKIVSVTAGAFLTGNDVNTSVQSGMSMAQIGEFSFIIAAAGLAIGAIGDFLYPVAIAVSVITTFVTPFLIRSASKAATFVDHHLPQPIETFITLYGSWIGRLRHPGKTRPIRHKLILYLLGDCLVLILIIAAAGIGIATLSDMMQKTTGTNDQSSRFLVIAAAGLLAAPFVLGMIRLSRALGVELANHALPDSGSGRVDLAEAPRTLMVITLQIAIILGLTLIIFAATQPFLPATSTLIILLLVSIVAGVLFWKKAANLQGHVRAGGQIILEALGQQVRNAPSREDAHWNDQLEELLPGLGSLEKIRLEQNHPAIGRSLADLNIHAMTGAKVISIFRKPDGVVVPGGNEVLMQEDVLVLIGTDEAVVAAKQLLASATS